ncbi:MAG TPA: hypothetical protein VD770_02465, partial [Coxiellaceae bacterium]|nr:hypothetical protein [Coxiellaceae bacterium]
GFDRFVVAGFGEEVLQIFVQETLKEMVKLENHLTSLETDKKIVVMHYSPISETLEGEPREIHAFLGCSRFADTIDRFMPLYVFHGHAHHGKIKGHTAKGVPVYNCSREVLKTNSMEYLLLEI